MNGSRLWLALVLALFCLPLFVDLGRGDVRDDEAIYSFAVDRILETGDWLEPKSIPNEDREFLEKPPLKFWIVALPIRAGLLPHDQFGVRFWDALFGGVSFVYVFLLGRRLLNDICGAIAVLVLFVHWPLIFDHGIRTNNMEAPLLLCYCGGVFHYLEWTGAGRRQAGPMTWRVRAAHAVAVGLYFVLGFMTKFVAALFLPLVLGAASLLDPDGRRRLVRGWATWVAVGLLVVALCAPWFVWAHMKFGGFFWQKIFGEHVYTRFTAHLDPGHVRTWSFYFSTIHDRLSETRTFWPVAGGMVLLGIHGVRRRWLAGQAVVLWFLLPISLMSLGTSKLYHYSYPFLPSLALAAGYVISLCILLLPAPLARALEYFDRRVGSNRWPLIANLRRPPIRGLFVLTAFFAVGVAVVSILYGPIRVNLGGIQIRNSDTLRPGLVAILCVLLAGFGRTATRIFISLLVLAVLPIAAYPRVLRGLTDAPADIRQARECVRQVQEGFEESQRGMYVDVPPAALSHELYYYFRHVRPWTRAAQPSPDRLPQYLGDLPSALPALVWEPTYQEYTRLAGPSTGAPGSGARAPSMIVFEDIGDNVLLLLPGPYGVCGPEGRWRSES